MASEARPSTRTPREAFLSSFSRREALALLLALVAHVALHVALRAPTFGEDDAARMAVDATGWHLSGRIELETTDYRMRTSPLYLHALAKSLGLGLPIAKLPSLMTSASIISGAVALLAMYLLGRRLVGRAPAAIGCALFAVGPAPWLGSIYGMAHVPALAAWLLAMVAFSTALEHEADTRRFAASTGVAATLAFVALGLKADLVLTGLAFPGLALVKRRATARNLAAGAAIVVVGLGVQMLYVKAVVSPPSPEAARQAESVAAFAVRWQHRFPFELRALVDHKNLAAATHSAGPFLYALALLALLCHAFRPGTQALALWAAGWSLPLILFWGLIIGNSARHNMGALPPLMLLLGKLLVDVTGAPRRASAVAALAAFLGYFADVQGDAEGKGTMIPKTNLLALSREVAARSVAVQEEARELVKLRVPKKAAIERNFLPFVAFEALAAAQAAGRLEYTATELRIHTGAPEPELVRLERVTSPAQATTLARKLREQGYEVRSHDYKIH